MPPTSASALLTFLLPPFPLFIFPFYCFPHCLGVPISSQLQIYSCLFTMGNGDALKWKQVKVSKKSTFRTSFIALVLLLFLLYCNTITAQSLPSGKVKWKFTRQKSVCACHELINRLLLIVYRIFEILV